MSRGEQKLIGELGHDVRFLRSENEDLKRENARLLKLVRSQADVIAAYADGWQDERTQREALEKALAETCFVPTAGPDSNGEMGGGG